MGLGSLALSSRGIELWRSMHTPPLILSTLLLRHVLPADIRRSLSHIQISIKMHAKRMEPYYRQNEQHDGIAQTVNRDERSAGSTGSICLNPGLQGFGNLIGNIPKTSNPTTARAAPTLQGRWLSPLLYRSGVFLFSFLYRNIRDLPQGLRHGSLQNYQFWIPEPPDCPAMNSQGLPCFSYFFSFCFIFFLSVFFCWYHWAT